MEIMLEERKLKEIEWADKRRSIDPGNRQLANKYLANYKYYSVARRTKIFVDRWLRENCEGKDVFEMACGNGCYSETIAEIAKSCLAADIAPLSIQQAKERSKDRPIYKKIDYRVLDCEKTGLPDNSFDVICEGGALHHMDIHVAFREAARLLRPEGKFLCVEAIRHNPIIHLYRKLTPHLRTAWEADHILGKREIMVGASLFRKIEIHFFHYTTILAVPFRKTFVFEPFLTGLEKLDAWLEKIPGFRWMAWQAAFILSDPIKS